MARSLVWERDSDHSPLLGLAFEYESAAVQLDQPAEDKTSKTSAFLRRSTVHKFTVDYNDICHAARTELASLGYVEVPPPIDPNTVDPDSNPWRRWIPLTFSKRRGRTRVHIDIAPGPLHIPQPDGTTHISEERVRVRVIISTSRPRLRLMRQLRRLWNKLTAKSKPPPPPPHIFATTAPQPLASAAMPLDAHAPHP